MTPVRPRTAVLQDGGARLAPRPPRSRWLTAQRRLGLAGQPWQARVLTGLVLAAALIVVVLGVRQPTGPAAGALSLPVSVGVAAALAAAAQLARLRFQLGPRTVDLSGGEAAFVIGFALLPAGWLPAATFAGAAAALLLMSLLGERRPPAEIAHLAASLTLGVTAATAVATQLAGASAPAGGLLASGVPGAGLLDSGLLDSGLLGASGGQAGAASAAVTPAIGLALLAGCVAHLVVTTGLSVLTLALHRDVPVSLIMVRTLQGRLPIFVGNVLLGLFTLLALGLAPGWLLLVPPAGWLLHRGYRLHLRAEEERRRWPAFARATRSLGATSEQEVAAAGIRGALEVFGARQVEIAVLRPGGVRQRWTGDHSGRIAEVVPGDGGATPAPAVTRALSAVGAPVGELSLWLPTATPWSERDDLAVAAYGDALANALHDAATQQRLGTLGAQASHRAVHDPLTGLRNRAALLAQGDEVLQSLDRGNPVALLLLDLNDFSRVNATLGQHAGDELLAVAGARLGELTREHDLLARLGDDEFAVLLPHVTVLSDTAAPLTGTPPLPQALRRAHELVHTLSAPAEIAGIRLSVEAAVGVVVANAGCFDMVELVRRAEIALGAAKDAELSVLAYEDSQDIASTDHLAMLAELRDALAVDDQLVLALQPAVDLDTGAPTGVEALSRWHHPRRGWLSPAEFIVVIERSELLGPFTRYLLDHSLAAAASWSAAGLELPVSVNVAARSLLDPSFPEQVSDALRRSGMPPHRLVLEITETMAVSDQPIVEDVVRGLRRLGVQLSVDDFGTGYSSLAILERMPVDELKVDRSFVSGMADSPRAAAIVRFAVELGRSLNLRVVAEGVETADQRAELARLGCTSAQGYHFCKPLPADKIVDALRSLSAGAPPNVVPLRADGAS